MKILVCSLKGEGAWFVWLLKHNGHDVEWTCPEEFGDGLEGLIPKPRKSADPRKYDLIVFDATEQAEAAEHSLSLGIPTIGDSALSDALEDDRIFGIEAMEEAGIKVPAWEAFDDAGKAIAWLQKTHKRCVLKPVDDAPSEMTYVAKNEADMIQFIEKCLPGSKVKRFILQEFVSGTEVSCEAWFTGSEWCAVNYTLEEKKFMAGGLGPNTGSAGNVLWMPSRPTPLFEQGLKKVSPLLADAGYRGMLDLNMIVTDGDIYGLEWTPRFGYDSSCCFVHLLPIEFGEFLHSIATGITPPHLEAKHRFVSTIRLSVPPYPNHDLPKRLGAHQPIKGLSESALDRFFVFDIKREDDGLIVYGEGNLGSPIGCSESLKGSFDEVMACVKALDVPDLQYRCDVAECVQKRYETLERQGWLRPLG